MKLKVNMQPGGILDHIVNSWQRGLVCSICRQKDNVLQIANQPNLTQCPVQTVFDPGAGLLSFGSDLVQLGLDGRAHLKNTL